MVWSQYVYEATVGLDAAADDSGTDDADAPVASPPTIHDFQDTYSDELWYLFDVINTLIHDAFLEHTLRPRFDEFVELCYYQFEESTDPYEDCEFRPNAEYILSRVALLDSQDLVKQVTTDDFIRFLKRKY